METADSWLRWTRAVALATVASLVAVWAHASAGGRLPSAAVLVAVAAGLAVLVQPLLARPASALRVVLLTVGGQTLAHAALSLTAGHRGDASRGAGASHSPPYVPVPLPVDGRGRRVGSLLDHARSTPAIGEGGVSVPDPVTHLVADATSAGAPMLLAHLAAAVLVGAWLAAGERSLWTMLTLAWQAMVLLVARSHSTGPAPAAAAPVVVARAPRRVMSGGVVRRGPPLLLGA